ncbi:MAG TPA: hypothetical protein VJ890_11030 [Vineibacter sp.]|nr:hypothetical protein [Vineibacter sp.]
MRWTTAIAAAGLVLPVTAAAQVDIGGTQAAVATYQGISYDVAANCLVKQMSSAKIKAWPLVYAPPRTEAIVNLWNRGADHGDPIGMFHIRQQSGNTTIAFQERQPGRLGALARAAAERCAP